MKKTIPISLAQTLFYVEEDAYLRLEDYLDDLKSYFGRYEDSQDLLLDIESRIREQLLDHMRETGSDRIVTVDHVDRLIKSMGRPSEFDVEDASAPPESKAWVSESQPVKKIYRDKDNAIFAGVAAGLAAYFRIDPLIIRSVFFISIFFGGLGILFYLFLWFVVPAAKTAQQKLEMQGSPVTLNEFARKMKSKKRE